MRVRGRENLSDDAAQYARRASTHTGAVAASSANTADTDTTSRAAQKSLQKNNIGDETVVAPSSAAAA